PAIAKRHPKTIIRAMLVQLLKGMPEHEHCGEYSGEPRKPAVPARRLHLRSGLAAAGPKKMTSHSSRNVDRHETRNEDEKPHESGHVTPVADEQEFHLPGNLGSSIDRQ